LINATGHRHISPLSMSLQRRETCIKGQGIKEV